MRLAYRIPHKVTLRMVGPRFVAVCSCKQWSKTTDPRRYDGMLAAWYDNGILPSPIGELIEAGHAHATDHVLAQQRLTRKQAA